MKTLKSLFDFCLPSECGEIRVAALVLDSRAVEPGALFFAQQGAKCDGKQFISAAVESGSHAVVSEADNGINSAELVDGVVYLQVVDIADCMAKAAAYFYGEPSKKLRVVGITGTNGKTSCADLLVQSWRLLGFNAASIGTLGWSITEGVYHHTGMTTPDALTLQALLASFVDAGISHVAIEVSSHAIAQKRHAYIEFDARVLINISRDHLDYHGDMQVYSAIKKSFIRADINRSVINADDSLLHEFTGRCVMFSVMQNSADWQVVSVDWLLSGMRVKGQYQGHEFEFTSQLMGLFNLANVMAVCAVLKKQAVALDDICVLTEKLTPVSGRLERVSVNPAVYIDYAHTPDALEKALTALRLHSTASLSLIFGCGGDRDQGKRPLMGAVAESLADKIIITTDNSRSENPELIASQIVAGMSTNTTAKTIVDRREAIKAALAGMQEDELLLIAGKGHEQYQEILGEQIPFSDKAVVQGLLQ